MGDCSQGRTTYHTPFSNPIAANPIPSKAACVPRLERDPSIHNLLSSLSDTRLPRFLGRLSSTIHANQLIVPHPMLPNSSFYTSLSPKRVKAEAQTMRSPGFMHDGYAVRVVSSLLPNRRVSGDFHRDSGRSFRESCLCFTPPSVAP